jgi:hypothetical protein
MQFLYPCIWLLKYQADSGYIIWLKADLSVFDASGPSPLRPTPNGEVPPNRADGATQEVVENHRKHISGSEDIADVARAVKQLVTTKNTINLYEPLFFNAVCVNFRSTMEL